MRTLTVDLGERSYPIYIGPCLHNEHLFNTLLPHREIAIVTNETVAPIYLSQISSLFGADKKVITITLPDGEKYKNLQTLNLIFDQLLENNFSRQCALIALGGGVIGDMTGFAAAAYQRGVDFVQVPTTLLSQVDSSVGGKTGVNHLLGKNMIGAFKQPLAVFIDPETLNSLPKAELAAGMAEVIKHGVIQDESYLKFIETNLADILSLNVDAMADVIEGSCRIKSRVVASDETEKGLRAILNLGHTFGHAIETCMGYGNWLHGEAVAVGMLMALDLSERSGFILSKETERLRSLLERTGLPTTVPEEMTEQMFLSAMYRDKKADAGQLKLVLIKSLGEAFVTKDFSKELLQETLVAFTSN